MNENTVNISKRLYVISALTAFSLLVVFLTIRFFPDWPSLLAIGVFMLLFGHTTWSWFSFTMIQSREDSLKDMK